MLSLPYGPTLTSIADYLKNHSFDQTDLLIFIIFYGKGALWPISPVLFPASEATAPEGSAGPLGTEVPRTPYPIPDGRAPACIPELVWPLGSQGAWSQAAGHRLGAYPTHCDGGGRSDCIQGSLVFGALQSLTSIPSINPAIGKPLSENQMVYPSLHTDETAGTQTSGLSPEGHLLPTAAWCLPPV